MDGNKRTGINEFEKTNEEIPNEEILFITVHVYPDRDIPGEFR